ncbi:MAG: efflux RND transporter periplasmic adaptor subunit [Candidatus Latescibacteria bacterium]|nr:efflux RND transporter periplasmic adaptor subunit [Candidatus Latescibacterota bacterium]
MTIRLALLGLLFGLTACSEAPPPEPVIRPVRYQSVLISGGEQRRLFSGTAQAALESRLSFKVQGTLDELAVSVGDRVAARQLIARIDERDYRLQVENIQAGLASAQARARNADNNYARLSALYESGNISESELDGARTQSQASAEEVIASEKQLELATTTLGYTRLVAPVDGSIAAVQVEEGENVSPGQPIVLLTSGSRLEVEVAVPEMWIAQVAAGEATTVTFDAIPDKIFTARVTEVGVTTTGAATTFPVTVQLDHADSAYRPGMAATVEFELGGGDGSQHIYVPLEAVGADRQGRFVYMVKKTGDDLGTVHRRSVQTGDFSGELLEILQGLEAGDQVVTAGVSRILDGQQVRLLGTSQP